MIRFKQQIPEEECIEILKNEPRGVLSVLGDDDYPYTVPMDFIYEPKENRIYFHCAKVGHKLDAIARHDKASFCVMDEGFRKSGEWALNISSVIVFGRIRPVEDREKTLEKVLALGIKYHPTVEAAQAELDKAADRVLCLEMEIEHMTGKLVNES
jgi:nitroimidazol reductase NimA-like FMN-containing flavoprotein (pyridoxamine 5'-phosphate oxidase superfamily)